MNYRNQKLLKLARNKPCAHCSRDDGTTVAAHANWYEFGYGMGIKSHDCFIAWLCHGCHAELDQGGTMTKQEKRDMWQLAHIKTMVDLFEHHLTVKG